MIHTRDSKIIISWPCSALATPFRFWIFPYLSSLFFCSWKMSKKGIISNIYFNEHFEIETFSFHFFFFVRVRKVNIFFFTAFFEMFISLSLQPSLTTREKSFFFARIHVYPITLNYMYSLPNIVHCFLKLFLLFHYRNFPNMHTITSLASLQLHLGIHKQQRSCLNIQQASNRGDFLNDMKELFILTNMGWLVKTMHSFPYEMRVKTLSGPSQLYNPKLFQRYHIL